MVEHIIIPIKEIEDRMTQIEIQMNALSPTSGYSYALSKMYTLLEELLATSKHIDL